MVLRRYTWQAVLIVFFAIGLAACQPSVTGTPSASVEASPTPIVVWIPPHRSRAT